MKKLALILIVASAFFTSCEADSIEQIENETTNPDLEVEIEVIDEAKEETFGL